MKNLMEDTPACNVCVLPNGLRIIHQPLASPVAYCGFAVDAGTRDEREDEHGMAHFVEHLLFKGTRKRKAWHILNRMENVGGDLNAYTNKEETVVYCAFPVEHFARAFELLADIVFHSTFPRREVEKETDVIIDEIQSYEDTPSELIFDDFEDLIFTPAGLPGRGCRRLHRPALPAGADGLLRVWHCGLPPGDAFGGEAVGRCGWTFRTTI